MPSIQQMVAIGRSKLPQAETLSPEQVDKLAQKLGLHNLKPADMLPMTLERIAENMRKGGVERTPRKDVFLKGSVTDGHAGEGAFMEPGQVTDGSNSFSLFRK